MLNLANKDEPKKSIPKPNNLTLYGFDSRFNKVNSPMNSKHPSINRKAKSKTRNNYFAGLAKDRDKFSKTFYNSPLRVLLTQIVIPK